MLTMVQGCARILHAANPQTMQGGGLHMVVSTKVVVVVGL
jgi:hypothetical protein